jgi:hypothetical protein
MRFGKVIFENESECFMPAPIHKIERNTLGLEAKLDQWALVHGIPGAPLASLKELLGLTFPREDKPLKPTPTHRTM